MLFYLALSPIAFNSNGVITFTLKTKTSMKKLWPVLLRIVFVFAAFLGLQYIIPYYFLVGGGLLSGLFIYYTSDDRPLALALLIGSVVFGVFAYLYGTV